MSKEIAFIYPGQGSQTMGMGRDFVENSETAKDMLQSASSRLNIDFEKLLFEENEDLEQTMYTQPAILLVSMIAQKLFQERLDISPSVAMGHSLGEFSALTGVGALDYLDALELVHIRGQLMQSACSEIDAGMMAVIGLDDESVENICSDARNWNKKIWPANYNSDGQIVIAGIQSDLSGIEAFLKDAGAKRALLLNMSVASHCHLLSSAQPKLKEKLDEFLKSSFIAPVISNVTAKSYNTKADGVDLLTRQLVEPVRYKQSILELVTTVDTAIEFGNGAVLKGLNRRIDKSLTTLNVSDMTTLEKAVEELK